MVYSLWSPLNTGEVPGVKGRECHSPHRTMSGSGKVNRVEGLKSSNNDRVFHHNFVSMSVCLFCVYVCTSILCLCLPICLQKMGRRFRHYFTVLCRW